MDRALSTPEILDGPLVDGADLRANLRDLRRVNRFLGGTRLSLRAIGALVAADASPIAVLDVGTGAADIPKAICGTRRWRRRISVTAVDNRPEVLAAAAALDPALRITPGLSLRLGDGTRLAWPEDAFDVSHASLLVHHLEPPDAIALLRELRRTARRGVVVNDLIRGSAYWALAWAGSRLLTGSRMTRHDAPLSVRRAYALDELIGLLGAAGLRPTHVEHGLLGHRVAIAAVPA